MIPYPKEGMRVQILGSTYAGYHGVISGVRENDIVNIRLVNGTIVSMDTSNLEEMEGDEEETHLNEPEEPPISLYDKYYGKYVLNAAIAILLGLLILFLVRIPKKEEVREIPREKTALEYATSELNRLNTEDIPDLELYFQVKQRIEARSKQKVEILKMINAYK